MIRYLSSLKFTLILIFFSAFFVGIGTFIESKSGSHDAAEQLIYGSLYFKLLLGGFFLNILLSTLSRWPFQKRHIPFIITHIGLLMVILGVFVKQQWGTQGTLYMLEGTATKNLKVSGQYALYREKMDGTIHTEPVISSIISGNETFHSWIEDNHLYLLGYPPFPLPVDQTIHIATEGFHLMADKRPPPSDLRYKGQPYLYFEAGDEKILLHHGNGFGKSSLSELKQGFPETYAAYDKGLRGYTAVYSFPLYEPHEKRLIEELRNASGQLSPPLELLKQAAVKQGLDFPSHAVAAIRLASTQTGHPLEETIDWSVLEPAELNALRFARNLIPEALDAEAISEHLRSIDWPLDPSLHTALSSLYSLRYTLPYTESSKRLFPLFLVLYGLDYETLISSLPDPPSKQVELESPLLRKLTVGTGNSKCLLLQEMALALNSPLKTACLKQKELLQFSEATIELPFEVRLHSAEEIKYPFSSQAAEYRCKLSIQGEAAPCSLSMNQVHETEDGYRLYLSGMRTVDPFGVRSIQIIINYDPAKSILTYPGALLVSIGTLLLLWQSSKKR